MRINKKEISEMKVFINEGKLEDVKSIIDSCTYIGGALHRTYPDHTGTKKRFLDKPVSYDTEEENQKMIDKMNQDSLNQIDINTLKIFTQIVNASCGWGTNEDDLKDGIERIKDSKTLNDIENMFKNPPSYYESVKARDEYIEADYGPYTNYKVSCTPCGFIEKNGYKDLEDLIRGETSGPFGKELLNLKRKIEMSKYGDDDKEEILFAKQGPGMTPATPILESEVSKPILDLMKRMKIIK